MMLSGSQSALVWLLCRKRWFVMYLCAVCMSGVCIVYLD